MNIPFSGNEILKFEKEGTILTFYIKKINKVKNMKDENSILYVQTTDTPEKQYSPLVLAQTAKMMDIKPIVYYLGTGLKI